MFDISKYRDMFLEESSELFESIYTILLDSEKTLKLSRDEMDSLFRNMHTLKGSASAVDLKFFSKFAHEIETFLDKLRDNLIYEAKISSILIECIDRLRDILDIEISEGLDERVFKNLTDEYIQTLEIISDSENSIKTSSDGDKKDDLDSDDEYFGFFDEEEQKEDIINSSDEEFFGFFDDVYEDSDLIDGVCEISDFSDALESKKKKKVVNKESIKKNSNTIASNVSKTTKSKSENILTTESIDKIEKLDLDDVLVDNLPKNDRGQVATIRVNLSKIDTLMNSVGELVITNAMLFQFSRFIENSKLKGTIFEKLELLNRHIRELQDSIMSVRMIPLEQIYSKFPKIIRDLSKRLDKKVELSTIGSDVEIDKAMIEGLTDPLTHIIRNSLDHGIEEPKKRLELGKSEVAKINLTAEQSNGQIIISISDDGAGIDVDRVAQKALDKGLITDIDSLNHSQKLNLIFEAGLSTVSEISDISGRGVGMDIVKNNISNLGGIIKVESERDVGTKMTIILPLTLAILDGLNILVGDKKYILPLASIVESLQPTLEMIKSVGDGRSEILMLREDFIPIIRLHKLFNIKPNFYKIEDGMLIIVKSGDKKVAFFVDEFLTQQQVVVKPLDKNFKTIQGISGATVRGDGTIGLILDVIGIIDRVKSS